jgi:hypothetical protein
MMIERRRTLALAALVTITLCVGCGGDVSGSPRATVRDSAGVHIVESSAPSWREDQAWSIDSGPELDIGVADGDPHYQLDQVRDAVRMTDGRIVIANGGSNELRYYDATGRYLMTSGRKGKGPGEFNYLSGLLPLGGDTIAALDDGTNRIGVFDGAGHFMRSVTLRAASAMPGTDRVVGRLPDGSWLEATNVLFGQGALRAGVRRDTTQWIRFRPDGTVRDTIARLPGDEMKWILSAGTVGFGPVDFGRKTLAAMYGDRIYAADNASYEIRVLSPGGALRQIIRRNRASRPITSADVKALDSVRLAGVSDPNARRMIERMTSSADLPHSYPAYQALVVDIRGDLWVKDYPRPTDTTATWAVFEPSGTFLGDVRMPGGLRVFEIGDDYVLGSTSDDLDVPHVVMYRLRRR